MLFCRHDCRFEQNDKNTEIQKESLTNGKNKYFLTLVLPFSKNDEKRKYHF